jgi:hypothetical protein
VRHQEIIFNLTGQNFFYDPPEPFRASGTPTVTVYPGEGDDDGSTETATTGACSVDSVDTTFSASMGDRSIAVASGTGIARGRRYLLTAPNGDREIVECISITGTTVGLRHPLINDYASSSTFEGTRISISVNSTWVADRSKLSDAISDVPASAIARAPSASGYRLRWSYTVNGEAMLGVTYADLVRYQAKNLVTPLDVDRLFPGWIDRLPVDYRQDQGAAFIEEAFQAVRMDALTDAQLVRKIRDTQVLVELVKYRANVLSAQNNVMHNGAEIGVLTVARDLYDQRYGALIREPKVAVDQGGGGAGGEAVRFPAFRR